MWLDRDPECRSRNIVLSSGCYPCSRNMAGVEVPNVRLGVLSGIEYQTPRQRLPWGCPPPDRIDLGRLYCLVAVSLAGPEDMKMHVCITCHRSGAPQCCRVGRPACAHAK